MPMYKIFVENLVLEGIHGVTVKEKERPQPFRIDMWVKVDHSCFGQGDNIEATVDYRQMKCVAENIVTKERHMLLETIAEKIANTLLVDSRVRQVHVTIRKLTIWNVGTPGVTVES